jgi:hypothetical protein
MILDSTGGIGQSLLMLMKMDPLVPLLHFYTDARYNHVHACKTDVLLGNPHRDLPAQPMACAEEHTQMIFIT